ncbi:MAG: exo-alpha-sialidase, partial [bacterium]
MMIKVATVILIIIASSLSFAQPTPSVVADQVANDGPVYYQHEKNVARASNGVLMAAWQDLAGTGGQAVYSTYDDVFMIWNPPIPISAASVQADEVALVADNQGRIHATWKQDDGVISWQVYYAKFEGSSFSTPVRVSTNDTLDAEESSIEVDSNGRIFVVWNTDDEPDGDEWILCSISADDGATWSVPDTLSSPDGVIKGTSITSGRVNLYAGSAGKIAAAWHEDYPGREREIYVNLYDGAQWQGAVVVSDTTALVSRHWYPTVCMDSQDNVHVIYSDDQGGSDPRHILHTVKTWSAPQWPAVWDTVDVDTAQDYQSVTSVVDLNDYIHVAYRREIPGTALGLDEIAYRRSEDGGVTWTDPVVLSRVDHDAGYCTFAAR